MPVVDPKIIEFGVVGLALIIVYRLSGIVGHLVLHKKGIAAACQVDPMCMQRIEAIHEHTEDITQRVNRGDLQCAWHGRDEVRDMLEGMRALNTSMDNLATAMNNRRK